MLWLEIGATKDGYRIAINIISLLHPQYRVYQHPSIYRLRYIHQRTTKLEGSHAPSFHDCLSSFNDAYEHIICTQPYRPAALLSALLFIHSSVHKGCGFTIITLTCCYQTVVRIMRARKHKNKQANFEMANT